jgi:hypothetical protein
MIMDFVSEIRLRPSVDTQEVGVNDETFVEDAHSTLEASW